jgi:hypothetical protein
MKSSSKHLDSDRKETKASGEKKDGKGTLMDGIVRGLGKHTSPPVVDGIIRGIAKDLRPSLVSDMHKVEASATSHSKGMFGSGAFPEGRMGK